MSGPQPELTLLIPVYNGQDVLPATLMTLHEATRNAPIPVEIVFVDDGSRDQSPALLESFTRSHPGVAKLVSLGRNTGINSALAVGFDHASAPAVATLEMHVEHEMGRCVPLVRSFPRGNARGGRRVRLPHQPARAVVEACRVPLGQSGDAAGGGAIDS